MSKERDDRIEQLDLGLATDLVNGKSMRSALLTVVKDETGSEQGPDEEQDSNGPLTFTMSTSAQDRMQDTIDVHGWMLDNFKSNPVFLWAHDKKLPPVGKVVRVWTEDNALKASVEFLPKEMDHPLGAGFGQTLRDMYRGGFMSAVSVGFRPIKWVNNEVTGGIDFEEQELLELSAVPIPAHPQALIDARAKGIDTTSIEKLFGAEGKEDTRSLLKSILAAVEGLRSPRLIDTAKTAFRPMRWWEPTGFADDAGQEEEEKEVEEIKEMLAAMAKSVEQLTKQLAETEERRAQQAEVPKEAPAGVDSEAKEEDELKAFLCSDEFKSLIQETVNEKVRALTGELD